MNLENKAWEMTAGYRKKGSKSHRYLQCKRLCKFFAFARKRVAKDFGQIGKRTFKAFCLEYEISDKTAREYLKAINVFNQISEKQLIIKEGNNEEK